MPRIVVEIAGLDRDCASAILTCLSACGLLPMSTYMWTGNERELLKECGYVQINLRNLKRGDILWKTGHTEMYLGNGLQGGARIDENGGTHGYTAGDQTGNEIGRSAFDQSYWKWESAWRYFGTRTVGGIPVEEATAQVMDHLIDHRAHGYSQDNRNGGGIEHITLSWEGEPMPKAMLDVDGWLGHDTIWGWQEAMHTPLDGEIWGQWLPNAKRFPAITCKVLYDYGSGSSLVRAVQKRLGISPDGVIGYIFIGKLQERLKKWGYDIGDVDNVLGRKTGRGVQQSLNDGKW